MFARARAMLPPTITAADGTPVALRRSSRARRLILTVSRATGTATLTLPTHAAEADARAFLAARAQWLVDIRSKLPAPAHVALGASLPVSGMPLRLRAAGIRACRIDGEALLVPAARPVATTVAAWLRERARIAVTEAVDRHAGALPAGARPVAGITLRDTRSRWGSCTSEGRLMFNWRLAMAPVEILDYVAAHEVAHLAHLDHSPAFWAAVRRLMPDYTERRAWLRRHGPALQSWQFR